jgi:hypothetical protein
MSVALVAGFLLSSSVANGEDFVPKILEFFPGKWQVTDGDGRDMGVVEWKLVAGGKAIAGNRHAPEYIREELHAQPGAERHKLIRKATL